MKRINKWLEASLVVGAGLMMCYGSWGKEGLLPISEIAQVSLVFFISAVLLFYRIRQEKKIRHRSEHTVADQRNI